MKQRIYIETSVISYLTARPSTDAVLIARQDASRRLWNQRDQFELLVSDVVVAEISQGDPTARSLREDVLHQITLLSMPSGAQALAEQLLAHGAFPDKARIDALHIAIAVLSNVDIIASWNFRHIASVWARRKIEHAMHALSLPLPAIVTPEEIVEGEMP